jgi:hypothetical protein
MRTLFEDFLAHGHTDGTLIEVPLRPTGLILANMFFGLMRIKLYWPEIDDFSSEAIEFCRRSLSVAEAK